MVSTTEADQLTDFHGHVPRWLLERLGTAKAGALRPSAEPLYAVVLCVDISGFSTITRDHQLRGSAGIEELATIINDYLGRLTEVVEAWGGDVENLYGDALVAFWPFSAGAQDDALSCASGCADELVRLYDDYRVSAAVRFRIRVAVVRGALIGLQVGGHNGQWMFLL